VPNQQADNLIISDLAATIERAGLYITAEIIHTLTHMPSPLTSQEIP
jgi:hypothetical protein